MLSSQEEQQERRETLENDRKVREAEHQRILREGTTFHQFAQQETLPQGRFSAPGAISTPRVVGSTLNPSAQYPAASSAHQTELPPEPPLGVAIDQLTDPEQVLTSPEPSSLACAAQHTVGAPSSAPPDDVEAPPPSFTERDDGAA